LAKKAIIIGAGSSYWSTNMIEELASSNFKGIIFIADRILENTIMRGINPRRFNVCSCTIESCFDHEVKGITEFYINSWTIPYMDKIKVWLAHTVHWEVLKNLKPYFKIRRFERYGKGGFDLNPYTPVIQTCHNVGIAMFDIARKCYGCDQIALLGIEFNRFDKDTGGYSTWDRELEQSMRFLNTVNDCTIFNLSPDSRVRGNGIIFTSLEGFLTDNYELGVNQGEIDFG